jgi:ABC-2 type transport system ATP-binding protein
MGTISDQLALDSLREGLPGRMSAGEQRRATLGLALLRNPRVLLADEPLRGIDPIDSERILAAMRELARHGAAVVVTGHEMAMRGEFCDDTYSM